MSPLILPEHLQLLLKESGGKLGEGQKKTTSYGIQYQKQTINTGDHGPIWQHPRQTAHGLHLLF